MDCPLQILPIGGLGEIGMNCMLIGHRDRWVMVDCGVQWPDADDIGVERILPDLSFLARWADKIEAVVITHGHEDHIGALPWVLPTLHSVPVYATAFTRELIRHRLTEHKSWTEEAVTVVAPGARFQAGPFEVEPLRVTHSLPDCVALVLRCADGTIVHTGDWKIDEDPLDGERFDREGLKRVGDEGVTLLLSDSTNASVPGRTRGEREVAEGLAPHIEEWDGRIILAQFASNLHRLRSVVALAEATNRKLIFAGRSLWRYLEAARRDGRAPIDPSKVIDISKAGDFAARETLVVTTGSQGEPQAALRRASLGRHPSLQVGRGDLVLHSARVIPGNEAGVYDMFNQLARRGARLVAGRRTNIHASGHARQEEQKEMLQLLRPGHFVPVHGEYTFLQDHAAIAEELGVEGITVVENGEVFGVRPGATARDVTWTGRVDYHPLESRYNDGKATGTYDDLRLSERKRLAWNGVVVVDITVARDDAGRYQVSDTAAHTRAMWTDEGKLVTEIETTAATAATGTERGAPLTDLVENVEKAVRGLCRRRLDRKPEVLVIPHAGGLQ